MSKLRQKRQRERYQNKPFNEQTDNGYARVL